MVTPRSRPAGARRVSSAAITSAAPAPASLGEASSGSRCGAAARASVPFRLPYATTMSAMPTPRRPAPLRCASMRQPVEPAPAGRPRLADPRASGPPDAAGRFWGWLATAVTAFAPILAVRPAERPHASSSTRPTTPTTAGRLCTMASRPTGRGTAPPLGVADDGGWRGAVFDHWQDRRRTGRSGSGSSPWIYPASPVRWRFSGAVIGTLAVLLTARIARRMSTRPLLGSIAGLLLSLDGLEFVQSRTAMLDIFLMFWVLAAFGCLVVDRDGRRGWRAAARSTPPTGLRRSGCGRGGLARGVPGRGLRHEVGRGLSYIPAFIALAIDVGRRCPTHRRAEQVHRPRALLRDLGGLPVSFTLLPLVAYLATWTGWFATSSGYDRNWAAAARRSTSRCSPPLISLFEYNKAMLAFNTGLDHTPPVPVTALDLADDQPPGLLLLAAVPRRGTGVCAKGDAAGGARHRHPGALVGRPSWPCWCASVWWLTRRDWRAGRRAAGCGRGLAAMVLPTPSGPSSTSTRSSSMPFLVLAVALCLGPDHRFRHGGLGQARGRARPSPAPTCSPCC